MTGRHGVVQPEDRPPFGLADAYAVETPDDNRGLYARWASTYESGFIADNGYMYHLGVAGAFAETSNALPVDLFLDRVTLQYSIP